MYSCVQIGNPLLNSVKDEFYWPQVFFWSHGMISQSTYDGVMIKCDFFNNGPNLSKKCLAAMNLSYVEAGVSGNDALVTPYAVTSDVCVSFNDSNSKVSDDSNSPLS